MVWVPEIGDYVVMAGPWQSWQYQVRQRFREVQSGQVWLHLDGMTDRVKLGDVAPAPAPGDTVQIVLKEFGLWLQAIIDHGTDDPLIGEATKELIEEYHGALSTSGSWVYKTYSLALDADLHWAVLDDRRVPVNCVAKVPLKFWEMGHDVS